MPHRYELQVSEGLSAHLGPKMGQALRGKKFVKHPVPEVLVGAIETESIAAHAGCAHTVKALWCCIHLLQGKH